MKESKNRSNKQNTIKISLISGLSGLIGFVIGIIFIIIKQNTIKMSLISGLSGFVIGIIFIIIMVYFIMPSMMIQVHETKYGVDETITKLEQRIMKQGWVVSSISDMNESMAKHGVIFKPQVKIIKLCHPKYAKSVLTTNREVAAIMPCSIAVWQGDDGKTYMSEMNIAIMGKMFGGNIAKVMGGYVVQDEKEILSGLLKE